MCGRYHIDDGRDSVELREIIDEVNRRPTDTPVKTSGEIFPTDVVPVMCLSRRLQPSAFPMRWGYALPDGKRVINARSETAHQRPLFKDGMLQRRCAIPATAYYEWSHAPGERVKYAIRPTDLPLFYLAGIYRFEGGLPVFTILTRAPADNIAFILHRMPVILTSHMARAWISPSTPAESILIKPVLTVQPTAQPVQLI